MIALVEFLLAFLEATKTDARQSREPIYQFFIALSLLAVSALAVGGGIGLMLAGTWLVLTQVMPAMAPRSSPALYLLPLRDG